MLGDRPEFDIESGVLTAYRGRGAHVAVPEVVTAIGDGAFENKAVLRAVALPEGLRAIGRRAFRDCVSLAAVALPESVQSIRLDAFSGCSALAEESGLVLVGGILFGYTGSADCVEVPDGVAAIGERAFHNQKTLRRVTLPPSLTRIGAGAFYGCAALESVTLPRGIISIGEHAFGDCASLTEIELPESLTEIESWAFEGCLRLQRAVLPETLTAIGGYAFYGCAALGELSLPASLRKLGDRAFGGCESLRAVALPAALTAVGLEPFSGCRIRVSAAKWRPLHTRALKGCPVTAVITQDVAALPEKYRREAALGYVLAPDGDPSTERAQKTTAYLAQNASSLCDFAFEHPELLQFLCKNALLDRQSLARYLKEAQARGDVGLKAVLLNYQNTLDADALQKAQREEQRVWAELSLSDEGEEGIRGMAFAFAALPEPWPSRGELAAYLESYGARMEDAVGPKTDYLVANDPAADTPRHRRARELGVPVIAAEDFNEIVGCRYRDSDTVEVPAWVTRIPEKAFCALAALRRVVLAEGVAAIDGWAFFDCPALESVTVPESVTSIGREAFRGCAHVRLRVKMGSAAEAYAIRSRIPIEYY